MDKMPDYIRYTTSWNPWHGCHRVSEGCRNCYMFRGNEDRGIPDSNIVKRSKTNFDLPLKKGRDGKYSLRDKLVLTSMTSDFFIKEADEWRDEAWNIIRSRNDIDFLILTKRPERISDCLPSDWGEGYRNVRLSVSVEDQPSWDNRVQLLSEIPSWKKDVFIAPMIGEIETDELLSVKHIDCIYLGGEYGGNPRVCNLEWVLKVRESCVKHNVSFFWRNCGEKVLDNGIPLNFTSIKDQESYTISKKLDVLFDDPLPKPKQTVLF